MHERHQNRSRYFEEQKITTERYVIPYIESAVSITEDTEVLEIGCGEGGNLVSFVERKCKRIVGIDLAENKIENGRKYFASIEGGERVALIYEDIYDTKGIGKFDIIIMRDVIEHIHDQERFMKFVKRFLKPGGAFYLGFPPWYNPFGGHQQVLKHKFLSKAPYYHILPRSLYARVLKWGKESDAVIEAMLEVHDTQISIERFERIIRRENYQTLKRTFYLFNPNYEIKFGLKPRKVLQPFASVSFFRNFYTTAMYYVITIDETEAQKYS
ncbi:MAG: class I SAM-dependent methyltransferase [Crocinitomicaceae bacterium]